MEEEKTIKDIPNKITITIIGKRNSGKTTLLNSLIFPQIINNNNYVITYGYDIRFYPINDKFLIKFFDIGSIEIETNVNVFQSMSLSSHYVIYIIDPKIKESLDYIQYFEEYFKKNQIILIFNKIDQIPEQNSFMNNKNVQIFIQKYNIKNIFYVNSMDIHSINNLKTNLFNLIQKDLTNNVFQQIKNDDFNINPILFHKTIVDRSKRIYCQ